MKPKFNDPLAIKKQSPEDKPKDSKNSPWDYRCPKYDERTSCFVSAGIDYGVGHRQPVGHTDNPKQDVASLPRKSSAQDPKYIS